MKCTFNTYGAQFIIPKKIFIFVVFYQKVTTFWSCLMSLLNPPPLTCCVLSSFNDTINFTWIKPWISCFTMQNKSHQVAERVEWCFMLIWPIYAAATLHFPSHFFKISVTIWYRGWYFWQHYFQINQVYSILL